MKKGICFVITTLLFLLLSACADPPGPEMSSLPSDFYVQKAKESGEVISLSEEKAIGTGDSILYPEGDYILLSNLYKTNLFKVSVLSNNHSVCSWGEKEITNPKFWGNLETLFIVEENCPGMGDRIIVWDPSKGVATLDGVQIDIWTQVGSRYFKEN